MWVAWHRLVCGSCMCLYVDDGGERGSVRAWGEEIVCALGFGVGDEMCACEEGRD